MYTSVAVCASCTLAWNKPFLSHFLDCRDFSRAWWQCIGSSQKHPWVGWHFLDPVACCRWLFLKADLKPQKPTPRTFQDRGQLTFLPEKDKTAVQTIHKYSRFKFTKTLDEKTKEAFVQGPSNSEVNYSCTNTRRKAVLNFKINNTQVVNRSSPRWYLWIFYSRVRITLYKCVFGLFTLVHGEHRVDSNPLCAASLNQHYRDVSFSN